MPSYLARYQRGEHELVWAELLALGADVRIEPVYADACAVAQETMRRVRHNLDLLIPRLERLGYRWGFGETASDAVPVASEYPPLAPAKPDAPQRLDELERLAGRIPLALRAFYTTIGSVNLVGRPPDDWVNDHLMDDDRLDPLFVYPLTIAFEEYADWKESDAENDPGARRPFAMPVAPDHKHKYGISGGMWYHITLPNSNADTPLAAEWHQTTFVNYLRVCLRWGGFPGFARLSSPPSTALAYLTRDLLPI